MTRNWALGALVGTIAAVGAFASGASAAPQDCPDGQVCFFEGADYTGLMSVQPGLVTEPFRVSDLHDSQYPDGQVVANHAASLVNNSDHDVRIFTGIAGHGEGFNLSPADWNLGRFANEVQSVASEPPTSRCPDGQVCFFQDRFATGSRSIQTRLLQPPFSINNLANSHFDNGQVLAGQVSSAVNNTGRQLVVWTGINQTGESFTIRPLSGWDFTEFSTVQDNQAMSAETTALVSTKGMGSLTALPEASP
jgi:Peptidase inhibitor family I36